MKRSTSVENALQVLKLFSMDEPELSVTSVSEKLQVAKSTAHRLLASLTQEGFVYKDSQSNLYSLGTSVIPMMNIVKSQIPISNEVQPLLSELVVQTKENAHLCILDGLHVVYLATFEGIYAPDDYIHVGKRIPAHCTSGGKVLLAFNDEIANIAINHLHSYTRHKITDPLTFKKQLRSIRETGYVISKLEYKAHIVAIAVPVYNEKNQVIASISITIDVSRYTNELANRYIIELKKVAKELTYMIKLRKRSEACV